MFSHKTDKVIFYCFFHENIMKKKLLKGVGAEHLMLK